jgi:hypothetical protein
MYGPSWEGGHGVGQVPGRAAGVSLQGAGWISVSAGLLIEKIK